MICNILESTYCLPNVYGQCILQAYSLDSERLIIELCGMLRHLQSQMVIDKTNNISKLQWADHFSRRTVGVHWFMTGNSVSKNRVGRPQARQEAGDRT